MRNPLLIHPSTYFETPRCLPKTLLQSLPSVRSDKGHWSLVPAKNRTSRFSLRKSNLSHSPTTNASCGTDPLVHYGRHFGRTVHALCTVSSILNNGILRMGELQDQPEEMFTLESVFVLFILIDMILINQSVSGSDENTEFSSSFFR